VTDEIIEELWQIKDELACEAKYDVHVLCRELREKQTSSVAQIVDRSSLFATTTENCSNAGANG
jgi:hypothetical protein